MPRFRPASCLIAGLLLCGVAGAQPPEEGVLDGRHRAFTDADIPMLAAPGKVQVLRMRGGYGYGTSSVTDAGMAQVGRFKNLRVLAAGGLGLTDRSLEAIGELDNLEELSLDANRMTGEGLKHLTRLKKLRKLDLAHNPLRPESLSVLPALRGLTHLNLYGTGLVVDDALLERCSRLGSLEELRLPENCAGVTDRGLEHLARRKGLKNLSLIRARGVTDAGLARLAALTQLRTLELRELPSATPRGVGVVGKLTELRRLDVVEVAMDDAALRSLAPLKRLQDLLIWSVANGPVDLDVLGELTALRSLRTNQSVSSSALRALAKLDHLETITDELDQITDEDLRLLSRSPRLRVLVLGSDKVTAAALPSLAKMKSLRDLYVTDKVHIRPEQLTELGRSSLPDCRISLYRPPYTVFYQPPGDARPRPAAAPAAPGGPAVPVASAGGVAERVSTRLSRDKTSDHLYAFTVRAERVKEDAAGGHLRFDVTATPKDRKAIRLPHRSGTLEVFDGEAFVSSCRVLPAGRDGALRFTFRVGAKYAGHSKFVFAETIDAEVGGQGFYYWFVLGDFVDAE